MNIQEYFEIVFIVVSIVIIYSFIAYFWGYFIGKGREKGVWEFQQRMIVKQQKFINKMKKIEEDKKESGKILKAPSPEELKKKGSKAEKL